MSEEVMSTPIGELNNTNNSTVQNVLKNFDNINETNVYQPDDKQEMNNKNFEYTVDQDLYEQDQQQAPPQMMSPQQHQEMEYEDEVEYVEEKPKARKTSRKKSDKSLMELLKPYLALFVLLFVISYPAFYTKPLKIIPRAIDKYDNITIMGVFMKSLIGVILYFVVTKFLL